MAGCTPAVAPIAAPPVPAVSTPRSTNDQEERAEPAGDGTAIPRLGVFKVGEDLESMLPEVNKSPECASDIRSMGCVLRDRLGAIYEIVDGEIWGVSARKTSFARDRLLPFGLEFGDTLKIVAEKASESGVYWTLTSSSEPDTLILFDQHYYAEQPGDSWFHVEAEFTSGVLTAVKYRQDST